MATLSLTLDLAPWRPPDPASLAAAEVAFPVSLSPAATNPGCSPTPLSCLDYKGKDGVVTLDSGLMYKVISTGDGAYHPKVNSPCECHYAGTTVAGTEFDSSYSRGTPTTFAPNQVRTYTRNELCS